MDIRLNVVQDKKKPLLVIAVTSYVSMEFFKGQIDYLQKSGFDIAVVCSPGWDNGEGVKYYPIVMEREIKIYKDLISLCRIIKLFLKIKPDIVNAGTPKAGLLIGIAAFLVNVTCRVYTCHGLRLETLTGWKKKLLTVTEKVAAFCAHRIVCVSNSLRQKFTSLHLAAEDKVRVIGAGSCNGVDLNIFSPGHHAYSGEAKIIKGETFCKDAIFIGFVGRLTKDKGIYELVDAFEMIKEKFPNLYLLLLGEFEDGDLITEKIRHKIVQDQRIINPGYVIDTVPYYQLMRILVLPTYREGLPTVLLEAGAMGIPVVASRATGCVDIVVEGETGLLVPIGDSRALANAIESLLSDPALAQKMGQKARQKMEQLYRQEIVWENAVDFYTNLLTTTKKKSQEEVLNMRRA